MKLVNDMTLRDNHGRNATATICTFYSTQPICGGFFDRSIPGRLLNRSVPGGNQTEKQGQVRTIAEGRRGVRGVWKRIEKESLFLCYVRYHSSRYALPTTVSYPPLRETIGLRRVLTDDYLSSTQRDNRSMQLTGIYCSGHSQDHKGMIAHPETNNCSKLRAR